MVFGKRFPLHDISEIWLIRLYGQFFLVLTLTIYLEPSVPSRNYAMLTHCVVDPRSGVAAVAASANNYVLIKTQCLTK